MRWTSMELAALATAAVPGLAPTGVAAAADDARAFTSAVITDAEGNRWRVRSPQHQEAAMRLETELQVLRGFTPAIRAELPFRVPSVAGAVRRGELRTFVYNHLPGQSLDLDELTARSEQVADDVGRTVAAIHDLDPSVVDNADLPRYSAERFRQRRLNELDQAATTGQIPSTLLRRWEHAMEERELWDFTPMVTHGDLHEDTMLIDGERVVAVTGWTDLHIGDPADDFAWLTAAPDLDFSEAVVAAYGRHRRGEADPHLMRRAALAAEFALAKWLVRGRDSGNQEMIDEALDLLRQLEDDVETHGGQPIALTPMDGAAAGEQSPVRAAGAAGDTGEAGAVGAASDPAALDAPSATMAVPVSAPQEASRATSAPTADTPDEPTLVGMGAESEGPESGAAAPEGAGPAEPDETAGRVYPVQEDGEDDDEPAVITDASVDEEPVSPSVPEPEAADEPETQDEAEPRYEADPRDEAEPQDEDEPWDEDQQHTDRIPPVEEDGVEEHDTEAAEAADSPTEPVPHDQAAEAPPSETAGSIYERHPGLRPPGA